MRLKQSLSAEGVAEHNEKSGRTHSDTSLGQAQPRVKGSGEIAKEGLDPPA